ncbi:hypothetical protein BGZ90_009635 [Linnemannia elongata]|nr:hypothetical protein BGZ90_009635 [Linnemannia elongata]
MFDKKFLDSLQESNGNGIGAVVIGGIDRVLGDCWKQNLGRLETDWTRLRLTLDLVQLQKLDNLRLLTLDYDDFRRSSSPTRSP